MGVRHTVALAAITLLFGALTIRLYNVQIEKGAYYVARAGSRAAAFLEAARGNIFFTDKNGTEIPAAIKKSYPGIYVVPKEVDDPEETASELSRVLGIPSAEIEKKLEAGDDPYESVAKKVSGEAAAAVRALALPGVYVEHAPLRFYPGEETGSHLLGFVNGEGEGQYGIEAFYDKKLRGRAGEQSEKGFTFPEDGEDVRLTVDRVIQGEAEKILEDLVREHDAESGMAIVENPKNGDVLALAAYPPFNPNRYGEFGLGRFLDPVVQSIYEPGSVFKVITMAAGIDSGKIAPETEYVDSGEVKLDGYTIKNWDLKAHGRITMTDVIERSVNTGTIFAEKTMGHATFKKYLKRFGLAEKTGIDLPGEVAGSLSALAKGSGVQYATASFGQGIAVTPIRLIAAISAIANKGVIAAPRMTRQTEIATLGAPISEAASKKVTEMMVSAVDKAGVAKIEGYSVAGKTGTAFVPDFVNGGYTSEVINTYVGFAPASDPRFIILIRIDKPAGAPVAGLTVVPAFRDLAQFILNYYTIPPDRRAIEG